MNTRKLFSRICLALLSCALTRTAIANGGLSIANPIVAGTTVYSGTTQLAAGTSLVTYDGTAGGLVKLPPAASGTPGQVLEIIDAGGAISVASPLLISDTTSGDVVIGGTSLGLAYEDAKFEITGSNSWARTGAGIGGGGTGGNSKASAQANLGIITSATSTQGQLVLTASGQTLTISGPSFLTSASPISAGEITSGTLGLAGLSFTGQFPVAQVPNLPGSILTSGSVTIPVTTGTGGAFGSAAFASSAAFVGTASLGTGEQTALGYAVNTSAGLLTGSGNAASATTATAISGSGYAINPTGVVTGSGLSGNVAAATSSTAATLASGTGPGAIPNGVTLGTGTGATSISPTGAVTGAGLSGNIAAAGSNVAPRNSLLIHLGDSITQSPNGAGVQSWASILDGLSYFVGTSATNFGVGGSVISNGTFAVVNGLPSTGTTSWTGSVSVLHLTNTPSTGGGYPLDGGYWAAVMAVTGTNIPFGTTGVLSSGTNLTLSQPTTGSSGGTVTVYIGGNNIMDRLASQVYPLRPAASGYSKVYATVMGGANCLDGGETGAQTINDLIAVTGTLRAWGITPIVSTILPSGWVNNGQGAGPVWWTSAQESQREIVNTYITSGSLGAWVDSTVGFSGDPVTTATNGWPDFDGNGIHPLNKPNQNIASHWNAVMPTGGDLTAATPQYVDKATEFQPPITLDSGISISADNGTTIPITQSVVTGPFTAQLAIGTSNGSGYNQATVGLVYSGSNSGANLAILGISNCYPLAVNSGGNTSTGEVAIGYSVSGAQSVLNGNQKIAIQLAPNTEDGMDITTAGSYPYFFFVSALQPNINAASQINGVCVGLHKNTGQAGCFDYLGNNGTNVGWVLDNYSEPNNMMGFNSGDVVIGTGTNDNGYTLEVGGTEKVDSNLSVSGTVRIGTAISGTDGINILSPTGGGSAFTGPITLQGKGTLSGVVISSEVSNAMTHEWAMDKSLTADLAGTANLTNYSATSGTNINGGCAILSGTTYLQAPSAYALGGTSFTYTFWFQVASTSGNLYLICERYNGSSYGWDCDITSNALRAVEYSNGQFYTVTSGAITTNTPHFGAIVFNQSANTLTVYLDGVATSTSTVGSYVVSPTPMEIGGLPNYGSGYFTGSIWDVRAYSPGTVLSSAALTTLYNAGKYGFAAQALSVSGTAAAPANSGTAAGWATITSGTATYKVELYQ
jgi:hypothetical protein